MTNTNEDIVLYDDVPLNLNYELADNCALMHDGRTMHHNKVDHRHVYFIGHQTGTAGHYRYLLSVMFADDAESFNKGVAYMERMIQEKYQIDTPLVLVYVRNLFFDDEGVQFSATAHGFNKMIKNHQLSCLYGKYLIFGLLGDSNMMMHADFGDDAHAGIQRGQLEAAKLFNAQFLPLKICLTNLVSFVFDAAADENIEGIREFLDEMPVVTGLLH